MATGIFIKTLSVRPQSFSVAFAEIHLHEILFIFSIILLKLRMSKLDYITAALGSACLKNEI